MLLPFVTMATACSQSDEGGAAQQLVADGATLVRVASGFAFTEGPAADDEGNVFFTDQPSNRILRWSTDGSISVFMDDAGRANGLYFDAAGRLLACADANNQLWRISAGKDIEVLVSDIDGKRLNGPNDLWVTREGGIYFTDPWFQRDYWSRDEPEIESENVYFLPTDGEVRVVDDKLVKPNGIIGSGDRLYVADQGANKTYVYRIGDHGELREKAEFAPMGSDGMAVDARGNVYLTGDGVTVFSRAGEKIGHIAVDAAYTANVTFGGKDRDILFITALDAVYTLQMAVRGARQ